MTDLFAKYDVPAPRYTSYPTVPFWTDSPTTDQWIESLNQAFSDEWLWRQSRNAPAVTEEVIL